MNADTKQGITIKHNIDKITLDRILIVSIKRSELFKYRKNTGIIALMKKVIKIPEII